MKAATPRCSRPAKPVTMLRPSPRMANRKMGRMSRPICQAPGSTASISGMTTAMAKKMTSARSQRGRERSFLSLKASHLLAQPRAEQTRRAEHQDQDQDGEDHGVGPARLDVLIAHRAHHADDQPAEHGSRQRADAAEHRRREGVHAGAVTEVEADG